MATATTQSLQQIIDQVVEQLKQNDLVEKHLINISSKVYKDALNKVSENGFCTSFKIPEKEVLELFDMLNLDKENVKHVFEQTFKWPKTGYMYGNPYYHILLLLILAFRKINKEKFAKMCLFLILIRMWNGLKYKYIKYCNKNTMNYVVSKMVTKKHLVSKYKDPLDLILNYFVETIYEKYVHDAQKNIDRLRIMFNQCWGRLDQLFNSAGKSGLANLYYKAHQSGEALQTAFSTIKSENEEELTMTQLETKSTKIAELINKITTNIIMNTKPIYRAEFIQFVNSKTKVSRKSIEKLANELHNPLYKDDIESLLLILFNKLNIFEPEHICSVNLYSIVDKKILSSKHNKDVEVFKKHIKELLDKILEKLTGKKLENYSAKIAIIRAMTFILVYNVQMVLCKNKLG